MEVEGWERGAGRSVGVEDRWRWRVMAAPRPPHPHPHPHLCCRCHSCTSLLAPCTLPIRRAICTCADRNACMSCGGTTGPRTPVAASTSSHAFMSSGESGSGLYESMNRCSRATAASTSPSTRSRSLGGGKGSGAPGGAWSWSACGWVVGANGCVVTFQRGQSRPPPLPPSPTPHLHPPIQHLRQHLRRVRARHRRRVP